MPGNCVRAGVLLLVALPPVDATDSFCEIELPGPGLLIWLLTARRLLEFDDSKFSFDKRAWLLLVKGGDTPRVDDAARLELLVGVMGTQTSSSGHPLNLLSYDRCVLEAELKIPKVARVGVLGESLFEYRRDGLGVAVEDLEMVPEDFSGLDPLRPTVVAL